ncbi:MAG: Dam family site-specific DNA-(adenine-N6)-methyltransferase [Sedimentibacter sp.]|nr:Dam family site-specific DNA-(adenine-N6)-methyltransferase [Sedimentibacter sp.]
MKPILKYRGGKSKEIPNFSSFIPKDFDTYFEPFLGGGAVFFYLAPQKAVINDINEKLIQFYLELQTNPTAVREQLDRLQALYEANQAEYEQLKALTPDERVENKNEALYYLIRDMYNHKIPIEYLESVIYFFINKTAYSGMIRFNAQGEYNVPFGRYKNFNTQLITPEHFALIKSAHIMSGDYSKVFEMATEKDFMFLDPPYDCIFNDYGNIDFKNGFDEEQHRRLAADFRNLSCKALMIIGKTELTEELYGEFVKGEYEKSYAVNIRNRFKSESMHIIVTNY